MSDQPEIPDHAPIFENGIKQEQSGFCLHDSYTVESTRRRIVCNRCKAVLDPFDVVSRWARRIAVRDDVTAQMAELRKKLEQLYAEEKRVKARTRNARKKDAEDAVAKAIEKERENHERALGALRVVHETIVDAMRRLGVDTRGHGESWKDGGPLP